MELDGADVVVIGGGVIGLSTAYFLAKGGMDVALVDRGIPGWEASGRNGGWAVGYDHDDARMPLALKAIEIWKTLDDELGSPTEFVLGGSVMVALTEMDSVYMAHHVDLKKKWNVETQDLDLQGIREILPGCTSRALAGVFVPESGQANPQLTSQAWVWGILREGGRVHEHTTVTGVTTSGGRVTGVETTSGHISADKVVNAAGPYARVIAEMVEHTLPIEPVRIEILCTAPAPPMTTATFGGMGLYCRQAEKGHFHFGGGRYERMDPAGPAHKPTTALMTRGIAKRFVDFMPGLGHLPVLRTWAGLMDVTPDNLPFIGRLGQPEGMYVNAGFGGVGFSNSPGAGKALSEIILDGECSFDISGLAPERFGDDLDYNPPMVGSFRRAFQDEELHLV